jgi:hypothetical protein
MTAAGAVQRRHSPFGIGYPRPIGSVHRYHTVGGANGTTMVVMFVGGVVLMFDRILLLFLL